MNERLATAKQNWAVFCMVGWDIRGCNLTLEQASALIGDLKSGKEFEPAKYEGAKQIRKLSSEKLPSNKPDFKAIYNEAYEAGLNALKTCVPTPMIVAQHANMLDDNSAVEKAWYVEGGACGFAWVNFSPATQPFCKWLKKEGYVDSRAYEGGYNLWCSEGGQSVTRKEAWAGAFAEVCSKYGIKCYSNSRLD